MRSATRQPQRLGVVVLEPARPFAQRARVVLAEALDAERLEARTLERGLRAREVQRRGVGEHVALRERARLRLAVAQPRDAVVEQPAAGTEQAGERARVGIDVDLADVLDHADRRDRVETLAAQLAVVHHADVDAVAEARVRVHARARRAAWGSESVIPVTWTPWRSAAWSANAPQPQPTSSTRWPGSSASLVQTSSSLVSCASSSVVAPRDQIAHEYVIDGPRKSSKKSLETS